MIVESGGGVFGFDTQDRADVSEAHFQRFRRRPLVRAVLLFDRSVERDVLLQEYAAQKAAHALDRVLSVYEQNGSRALRYMLNEHNDDILSDAYLEGFELARLFLITPHISYHAGVQEHYHKNRLKVITALVKHFANFNLDQMQEVYSKLRIHPTADGSFQETVTLRRGDGVFH